jgi:hypothetical protein
MKSARLARSRWSAADLIAHAAIHSGTGTETYVSMYIREARRVENLTPKSAHTRTLVSDLLLKIRKNVPRMFHAQTRALRAQRLELRTYFRCPP